MGMNDALAFLAGIVVGGLCGTFVVALCVAAKKSDERRGM